VWCIREEQALDEWSARMLHRAHLAKEGRMSDRVGGAMQRDINGIQVPESHVVRSRYANGYIRDAVQSVQQ